MLNQDFRDMLLCLKEAGVDFMIVGAYALVLSPAAGGDRKSCEECPAWAAKIRRRPLEVNSSGLLSL